MSIKDKWWDIFEFFEYEMDLFEKSLVQDLPTWMTSDTPLKDREYFKFYLRAD